MGMAKFAQKYHREQKEFMQVLLSIKWFDIISLVIAEVVSTLFRNEIFKKKTLLPLFQWSHQKSLKARKEVAKQEDAYYYEWARNIGG